MLNSLPKEKTTNHLYYKIRKIIWKRREKKRIEQERTEYKLFTAHTDHF